MSVRLLDKTRKINALLHNNNSSKVVFNDICRCMGDVLDSDVLVISKKGKILGQYDDRKIAMLTELETGGVGTLIDSLLNERLLSVLSTKENVNLTTLGFSQEDNSRFFAIITPIDIAGERLGTLFLYRDTSEYGIDDIILSEYGTTVVGLEMMRSLHEESADEIRSRQVVQSAIGTLSYSEFGAIVHVFDDMDGKEGLLVASKIADKAGITRSVIVNALRKFESAGVIEARSSGMKGTYVKILNDYVYEELELARREKGM